MSDSTVRIRSILGVGVAAMVSVAALAATAASLGWRMEHDTPLLHYAGFLINEFDYVPYRDLFETSMPGTFLFHMSIGKAFGYGDTAYRLIDVSILALLAATTLSTLRTFGRPAAVAGVSTFTLVYLSQGQGQSLQRDYLGTVLVAFSLWVAVRSRGSGLIGSNLLIGALSGGAFLIKPHLIVGLPVILLAQYRMLRIEGGEGEADPRLRMAAATAAGFIAPIVLTTLWLWSIGGLSDFLDIVIHYLPLHNELTYDLTIRSRGLRFLAYLWQGYFQFGGYRPLLIGSLLGCGFAIFVRRGSERERVLAGAILALIAAYTLYPAIGTKFWIYHYFPFFYFASLGFGLLLTRPNASRRGAPATARLEFPAILCFLLLFPMNFPQGLARYSASVWNALQPGFVATPPKNGRVDEIATWLKQRLEPGDEVQPLDWSSGVNHALLIAKAPLATRFLYDYQFYHHTESPYIRALRREFLRELERARPRFIIEVRDYIKPWVSGPGTTREFRTLRDFIEKNYERKYDPGRGYAIYERVGAAQASREAPASPLPGRR